MTECDIVIEEDTFLQLSMMVLFKRIMQFDNKVNIINTCKDFFLLSNGLIT